MILKEIPNKIQLIKKFITILPGGSQRPPLERLCHNSKKCLIYACHAGLDPASRSVKLCKNNGFRVKPGMTKTPICVVLPIVTQPLS